MRVKVVRTPGELRDSIGHKVIVRKDWEGTVERELSADEVALAGFHPKQQETFYSIKFTSGSKRSCCPRRSSSC